MKSWLEPKAFWGIFCVIAFVQFAKFIGNDFDYIDIASAFLAAVIGGVFWGAIGTLIYKRFNKKN